MCIRTGIVMVGVALGLGLLQARAAHAESIGYAVLGGRSGFPINEFALVENHGISGTVVNSSFGGGSHTGTGSVEVDGNDIRLDLEATGTSISSFITIEGRGEWTDDMTVLNNAVSASNRVIYDSMDLVLTFRVTGQFQGRNDAYGTEQIGTWRLDLSGTGASGGTAGGSTFRTTNTLGTVRTQDIDETRSLTFTQGVGGVYGFHVELRSRVEAWDGWVRADFGNSLSLQSVLFADGTRPEDLGYVLQFDSGILSPNISAVPEPTSLALFGLGAGALALRRRKRKLA